MDSRWRETFQAWSETEEHRQRIVTARKVVAANLLACERALVSFSGGKDSTVLAHLVLAYAPQTTVLHWDYGPTYIPRVVHQEIIANARALGATDLRIETSPDYERLGERAINVMGRHLIGRLLPRLRAEGYDCSFVGLRREESLKRRRRMDAGRMAGPIPECWPLRDLTWMDVWGYIVAHDLPALSLYDARAALVGYEIARFTTLFDPEFARLGAERVDNVLHWRLRGR